MAANTLRMSHTHTVPSSSPKYTHPDGAWKCSAVTDVARRAAQCVKHVYRYRQLASLATIHTYSLSPLHRVHESALF